MEPITLLVLADPAEPHLAMLEALPDTTTVVAGKLPEAFERAAPQADVIFNCLGDRALLQQVWRMAPRVQWIHTRSAGLDGILFPELIESPVPLTNARGVFSDALAEFAIGAVLFFAKGFRRMVTSQMRGRWDEFDTVLIHGQTVGIVGYGDIGRAVAARAQALGMKVAVLRRRPELMREAPCTTRVFGPDQKTAMLSLADYVVIAVPLTDETRGMIGDAEFEAMKTSAVVINIGRGPVIDERALMRALERKRIQGAALDVFETEPLPAGHPFYQFDNVLLSPHCADHTPDWKARAMQAFLDNFERFRRGEPLRNVVDKKRGY